MKDPFLPLEEHFFEAVMVCKKNYDVEFEDIVFQTKEKLKPLQKKHYIQVQINNKCILTYNKIINNIFIVFPITWVTD
jgi:hypothetical protein